MDYGKSRRDTFGPHERMIEFCVHLHVRFFYSHHLDLSTPTSMNTYTAVLPLPTCVPAPSVWDAPLSVHLARLVVIPLVLYALFLASLIIPVVQRL